MIIFSSTFTSKKVLLEHANNIMENISEYTINRSYNHLIPAKDAAKLTQGLAASNIVSSQNVDSMLAYFYEQLSIHNQFAGIFYSKRFFRT